MTKKQSLIFRLVLFLAGAGIILLAFFLSKGERELTRTDAFVWVSIGLMYLVFFEPFFFAAITAANFSGKIPRLPLVWLGVFVYIAASVAVILLLAAAHIILLNTAIIIQAVLLFLFAIDIYFAFFTSSHVVNVTAEENRKQQYITAIKSKAKVLSLSTDRLPTEFEQVQKTTKQALDDIKYLYPVNGGAGDELESKIIGSLDRLAELYGCISGGAHPAGLETEATNLQMLVKERKLLRN